MANEKYENTVTTFIKQQIKDFRREQFKPKYLIIDLENFEKLQNEMFSITGGHCIGNILGLEVILINHKKLNICRVVCDAEKELVLTQPHLAKWRELAD